METRRVDVAVIGAGTAGMNARRQVTEAGRSVVLIESGLYGTTCARVGCMPSKLLIAAAEAAHGVERAAVFGVHADPPRIDGPAIMRRVQELRDFFVGGVLRGVEHMPSDQKIEGQARFTGPTTVQVDDHTRVEASAVVVATGSAPFVPPPFDGLGSHVLTSDTVFELEDLPDSIAVIGTGTIALELGQALHRLGVRTAFFNPFDEFAAFTDPDVDRTARRILGEELDVHLQAEVTEAVPEADSVRLRWRDQGGDEHEDRFHRVLVAAGRRPNLAVLDLAAAGLPLDDKGMPPWDPDTTQCGDAPVFLAGDVDNHRPVLHEAADDGRIAGSNAARWPDVSPRERRTPLAIAFTDPEMALVGRTWADLDKDDVAVGEVDYGRQGRARVMAENRGLVRLYALRRGCTLVGAEMVGPRVEHMAHLIAWAVQCRLSVQQALRMPVYHPVVEEGLRTALVELAKDLEVVGECPCQDLAEAPGR